MYVSWSLLIPHGNCQLAVGDPSGEFWISEVMVEFGEAPSVDGGLGRGATGFRDKVAGIETFEILAIDDVRFAGLAGLVDLVRTIGQVKMIISGGWVCRCRIWSQKLWGKEGRREE